jgi:hypothetical protein
VRRQVSVALGHGRCLVAKKPLHLVEVRSGHDKPRSEVMASCQCRSTRPAALTAASNGARNHHELTWFVGFSAG